MTPTPPIDSDDFLQSQIAYYRARAGEYDEWFLRQGRYDRGPIDNAAWFADVAELRQALAGFQPTGHVLELACGTGLWTEQLAQYATQITAVDAAEEVLALNKTRLAHSKTPIHYLQQDLFQWQPTDQYDVLFFSFWLSHVPPERFDHFWQMVGKALKDDGRVFFIDSLHVATSTANDHKLAAAESAVQERLLNDGRRYQIVKIFYEPERLTRQLSELSWQVDVKTTSTYFLYGAGSKRS